MQSLVAQLVKNPPAMQETPVQFLGWEDPLEKGQATPVFLGFPGGSAGKESACNVGDLGSIPGLGRSRGGEHDNPLQYPCLQNPHGQRSLTGYSPWGHKQSDTTERLSIAHTQYIVGNSLRFKRANEVCIEGTETQLKPGACE